MYANSRAVESKQDGIHEHLARHVARHAASCFRKPVLEHNRAAFDLAIAAWRAAGSAPLILDGGCGTGFSTLNLARLHPDHFVIGVDQSADRIGRQNDWAGALPPNQIRVRAELADFWRLLLAAGVFPAKHYMLYPNPWPKKDALARRWHGHAVFPVVAALGGAFECRSNWSIYVEECAAALGQLSGATISVEAYAPGDEPLTPFERKYRDSGHALWRCRVQLPTRADLRAQLVGDLMDNTAFTSENREGVNG